MEYPPKVLYVGSIPIEEAMINFQLTTEENAKFVDQLIQHDKRCIDFNETVTKGVGRLTWCFTPQTGESRIAQVLCRCGHVFNLA